MVHLKLYAPGSLTVTVDDGEVASLNMLVAETGLLVIVHSPVPTVGELPPNEPLVKVAQ
jgi:hypothetical protein